MYSVVRDSAVVWPYCTECGCRLRVEDGEDDPYTLRPPKPYLAHFQAHWHTDEDLRGHKCKYVNEIIVLDSLDGIFTGV